MLSVSHYYYYSIFNLIKIAWNYWIRMSMICKIMEIKEGVIFRDQGRGG